MKKYILALGLVSMLIGCNDDFMERYPLDNVTDENFWKTESDLKLYLNKLYPAYIKGMVMDGHKINILLRFRLQEVPWLMVIFIQITVYVQVVNQKNWQD